MDPAFDPIINGVFLLLGVLLLISSILQFIYGSKKNYALAFLCLIASMWFFRRFFWKAWLDYSILYIVFGGVKEVFIAPLVYFHVKMKRTVISYKEVLKHLAFPILIYVCFLVMVYFFRDYYKTISRHFTYALTWYVFLCYIVYFSLSFRELKIKVRPVVIPKVFKTVYWFLIFYTVPHLFTMFLSTISLGIVWYIPNNVFLRETVNGTWIYYLDWSVQKPLLFIQAIFMLFYAFIEIPFFKSLFYPKDILYDKKAIESSTEIQQKIFAYFNIEKIHTNKELTIDACCKQIGYSKRELTDYLKLHKNMNFTSFLNTLRVEEFKVLLAEKKNKIYDINSLAEMAGFKSRATFYRVFKEIEGITPTQYKKNL